MWEHTDGCAKQFSCSSTNYILSCLSLEFSIIIYILVGAPKHRKYLVGGLHDRYKRILKLAMSKILNPELILDNPFFSSSCRFMKMNKIKP